MQNFRDFESMADAARRLLAKMDERKRMKAAGSLGVKPVQIADQPMSPAEEGPHQSDQGVRTLDGAVPITVAREKVSYGYAIRFGRAASGYEPVSLRPNGRTRPVTPDGTVGADRANRHALEDW